MKKILYVNNEESGELGKPVFKDSLGKQLCIGDIVCVIGTTTYTINIVAKNCIYGWGNTTYNGNLNQVLAYKIINYTQIENLDEKILRNLTNKIEIKTLQPKEMTISQIEKELGYPIKIIK